MKAIVLLSGGMDSSTGLYWALKEYAAVEAISFNYGSKHNEREWESAKAIARSVDVGIERIEIDFIAKHFRSDLLKTGGDIPEGNYRDESMRSTVVPFRNGIMLSIAVGYAESISADAVLLANHAGDHAIYPDCRPDFIWSFNKTARLGTYREIVINSPFLKMTKGEIVALGQRLGVPWMLTYSCYKGAQAHCGECGTCVERKEAFAEAGVPDLTTYM